MRLYFAWVLKTIAEESESTYEEYRKEGCHYTSTHATLVHVHSTD